jgi:hypothetical protein
VGYQVTSVCVIERFSFNLPSFPSCSCHQVLIPPKDHRMCGNSSMYELSDDALSGIKLVIVTLEED